MADPWHSSHYRMSKWWPPPTVPQKLRQQSMYRGREREQGWSSTRETKNGNPHRAKWLPKLNHVAWLSISDLVRHLSPQKRMILRLHQLNFFFLDLVHLLLFLLLLLFSFSFSLSQRMRISKVLILVGLFLVLLVTLSPSALVSAGSSLLFSPPYSKMSNPLFIIFFIFFNFSVDSSDYDEDEDEATPTREPVTAGAEGENPPQLTFEPAKPKFTCKPEDSLTPPPQWRITWNHLGSMWISPPLMDSCLSIFSMSLQFSRAISRLRIFTWRWQSLGSWCSTL